MTTTYSPLSLLSASRTDRTSVLMHYMVEDFAGLDWNLAHWKTRPGSAGAASLESHPIGPALDDVTRRRLHALAGLIEMSREEAEQWYAEYWLVYTVLSAYARPLHSNGWGFVQMVARIDGLTQRARTLLPRLRVPGFECLQVTQTGLALRLREERPRSACFLQGILRRLADDFGTEITLSKSPELGSSAISVAVVSQVAQSPVRAVEPAPSVRRMKPAFTLSAPHRQNSFAVMAD